MAWYPAVCLPVRRRLHVDKEWRRKGGFTTFFRSYTSQTTECVIDLDVQATCRLVPSLSRAASATVTATAVDGDEWFAAAESGPGSSTAAAGAGTAAASGSDGADSTPAPAEGKLRCVDSWYLSSILGAGNSRNLALSKPYEDVGLVPLLSIAALVARDGARPPEVQGQVSAWMFVGLCVDAWMRGCLYSRMRDNCVTIACVFPSSVIECCLRPRHCSKGC